MSSNESEINEKFRKMWDFVEDISMKLGNFVTKKKFKQETEEL